MLKHLFPIALVLACPLLSFADVPLSADASISEAVDFYLDRAIYAAGITPAPIANDETVIRRTTLDLIGRIPTADEARSFVQSTDPHKRVQLVERLLKSPAYAKHQRNEFDLMLMADDRKGDWREYLLSAFQQNRHWDEMFKEIILAREDDAKLKGSAAFLKDRASDLDKLTNDTSRLFLGVSINCAQCHDHPFVDAWKQDVYYGMASFFNRTYLTKKRQLAEKEDGVVKFKTTKGVEKVAALSFLTGTVVAEPPLAEKTAEQKKAESEAKRKRDEDKDAPPPPRPSFSRREQLVQIALKTGEQSYLARSIVNRVWARLFGRGLVQPLDQMHAENKPSHPELLDWLERDLVAHQYDLRRLIRGLVLSDAYARSSEWPAGSEAPEESLFAVAHVRPLSPFQYASALLVGATSPSEFGAKADAKLDDLERRSQSWASRFEIPLEGFQVGVSEALLLSNNDQIAKELLGDQPSLLLHRAKESGSPKVALEAMYWNLLSRAPTNEELTDAEAYLAARKDRPAEAYRQVMWAILAGPEFRFNH